MNARSLCLSSCLSYTIVTANANIVNVFSFKNDTSQMSRLQIYVFVSDLARVKLHNDAISRYIYIYTHMYIYIYTYIYYTYIMYI